MDTSVLIQKQIKDNNEDLQNYMRDLKLWETEMKRKETNLTGTTSVNEVIPPVRRKKKKPETVPKQETEKTKKRIPGIDYSSWDKFDVEKACEEVDNESSEESVEENYADDATVKREQALYEKALGNRYVQDGKWDQAIGAYSRAITSDPSDAIFYANRALCYLKNNRWKEAEADCGIAVELDSSYVKAYQRRAEARKQLGRLEEAKEDLVTIVNLEPKNKLAQQDLKKIEAKLKPAVKPTPVLPKSQSTLPSTTKEEIKATKIEKSEPCKEDKPSWSSNECLVEPIDKPPHLRSKKTLKRIVIKDVNSLQNIKRTEAFSDGIQPVVESPAQIKQVTSVPNTSATKDNVLLNKGDSVECDIELPPPPKTSVQFDIYWKKIKNNRSQCYRFLKQIQGQDLPIIFKESLESNTFSNIMSVLASEFTSSGDPVLGYLEGFCQVRRFSALTLFMSSNDKSNLVKLFDHSKALGECSEQNIIRLKKLYEINN